MRAEVSYWLGPDRGRWTPSTWADLKRAATDGLLDEASWVEIKEKVAPGKEANRELARDLASLGLRSGLLVIGVKEEKRNVAGEVVGTELAGQRDRIDQVARDKVHPPLYVDTREIEDPDRPGIGCLLVSVPATGPHMADERYWGRGDTGKRVLHDPEVREHHARRRIDEQTVLEQVRKVEQDYLARSSRVVDEDKACVFLRVTPIDARRDCLLELTDDPVGGVSVKKMADQVARRRPQLQWSQRASALEGTFSWDPHALGRRLSNIHPEDPPERHRRLLQVVVEDGGALTLVQAEAAALYHPQGSSDDESPVSTLYTETVLDTVTEVLGLAGLLGDTIAAYQGIWRVAVRVSDLTGCHDAYRVRHYGFGRPVPFSGGSEYEETAITTTVQLVEEPWAVTQQLLARLVRALSVADRCLPYTPSRAMSRPAP